jgi:hypothetical protein
MIHNIEGEWNKRGKKFSEDCQRKRLLLLLLFHSLLRLSLHSVAVVLTLLTNKNKYT